MKFHTLTIACITALTATIFTGCSSTEVKSSWMDPETSKLNFQKTLVVMLNPDGATRRIAEDTIREQMPNMNTVSSYTLFPDNETLKKGERVRETLKQYNFDSAIVVRLVSKDTEVTSMGGPTPIGPYGSFWGAHGAYAWGGTWGGDIQTSTVIGLETNIYEMRGDKLVFSAVTKTADPSNIKELLADAGLALRKELEKRGAITPSK